MIQQRKNQMANYLKGIKINFIESTSKIDNGCSFDLSNYITDSNALMQDCIVNVYMDKGSDVLNPNRGTDLIKNTRLYGGYKSDDLIHIANFASEDTKDYVNNDIMGYAYDSPYNSDTSIEDMNEALVNNFTLVPGLTKYNNAIYNTSIETSKNVEIGDQEIVTKLYD